MQILNTMPIIIEPWYLGLVVGIIIISLIAAMLFIIIDRVGCSAFCAILALVLFIGLLTGMLPAEIEDPDRNQYEVIFDDSTTINEVLDKYEIIEQRGSIYVIQDK